MSDLTTVTRVKTQLGIGVNGTTNVVDDSMLADFVTQASQMITTYTQRQFYVTYGTLTYDSIYPITEGRRLYFTEDWQQVDFVWNGANGTFQASDYRLVPTHSSPKYGLELLPASQKTWVVGNDGFPQNAITVVGSYGYCDDNTRPADITLAATRLAAWLYQNRDNDGSIIQMADGNLAIPSTAPNFVFTVLDRYVRSVAQQ